MPGRTRHRPPTTRTRPSRGRRHVAGGLLILAAAPAPGAGATPRIGHPGAGRLLPQAETPSDTLELSDLERMTSISEVSLSPDGDRVLYRLLEPVEEGVGWTASVWSVPAAGGTPVRRFDGAGGARWAPAGGRLAFLRRTDAGPQVWVAAGPDAEAAPLTDHPGGVLDYAWAPDGDAIAFVGPAAAGPGIAEGSSQLYVQALGDAAARRLTSVAGDVHTAFFGGGSALSWAPDGRRIAFAVQDGRSFEDVYRADLYTVDVGGGAPAPLVRREGMDILPRFSPDGTRVAFVTSFGAVDRLGTHGLAVVDVATGRIAEVGRAIDAAFLDAPSDPAWSADGGRLLFDRATGTAIELYALDTTGGELRALTSLGGVASAFSFSADGRRVAFLASTAAHPFEVYVAEVGGRSPERLTRTNLHLERARIPPIRRVRWRGPDGDALEGLLIVPDGPGPHPIVVWMHGGPEGHAVAGFDPTLPFPGPAFDPFPLRLLAARGYAVFAPNFRGSAGYGAAHRHAAVPAPAARAAADAWAGVEMLADSGWVDPTRAAIVGWASGAFKAANAITRSDRYRAAVFGAGQTDLHAAFGEGDAIVQWRSLYGGSPWEVPERYEDESPILAAGRIDTPTLLLHGERDPLVPPAQTRQLYTYLSLRGVPAEFVAIPGEGHGIANAVRRTEVARRILAWLDRWLTPPGATPPGRGGSAAGGAPIVPAAGSTDAARTDQSVRW